MSLPASLSVFFAQMESQEGSIPRLDLDTYIQNYTGPTRFDRLIHIGKTCVPLAVEALKAAVTEAKKGVDIGRYREAFELIRIAAPGEPEAHRDHAWIERTDAANREETRRLDLQLKGYKNNLIKESIRMGNEDLGTHFENIGNLHEAAEAYGRMRQDVSTTKQIIDCGLHLVDVHMRRRDWGLALTNAGKITGMNSEREAYNVLYAKVVSGICQLGLENFREAAKNFLQADSGVPSSDYRQLASPNDIAIYGGLLALATFDRSELQAQVLDGQSFRTFLEHEPHIRKAISFFVNGRYSNCLSILESYRNEYLLDIYLHKRIDAIYTRIRAKCIVHYFVPFSCVTLESLNTAFGMPGYNLQEELIRMIRDGELKARIDAKNKLLVAVRPDPRLVLQRTALDIASTYEREAVERLRRINLVAAGLEMASTRKFTQNPTGASEGHLDDDLPGSQSIEV
ncbi:26S proteasome subunit RPN7-domain-containing protein [Stachybotrys elegans]|uniref:26S proteasome subunit RPN7-domain-containing protein n=1 Tax=Stachybotrys elegans TaxID=80388 RepID=A0A8K0WLL7_9HYPO|nr:26S proteasome subunit RPN7-domain-containing protein [Stachybotrys elegans]